jgi:tRNA(Ile)-lysidine synthase
MEASGPKRLHPFECETLRSIRRWQLLAPGSRVLAAVSGGADSTALLHALHALVPEIDLTVACGHVEHGLHEESAAHAAFVGEMALDLGVAFGSEQVDVRRRSESEGLSLEHAARLERYEALERLAERLGCEWIATGHTADDQAETVLLNVFRGTGLAGLRGIPPRRDCIVRPLLAQSRAEIVAYLTERRAAFVGDPTNDSREPLRNRVRHELMPFLDDLLGRPAGGTIARLAEAARLEEEALASAQEALWAEARSPQPEKAGSVSLSVEALRRLGRGGAALVLRRAQREIAGEGVDLSLAQVEEVLRIAESETAGGMQICGGCLFRREHGVLLVQRPPGAGK